MEKPERYGGPPRWGELAERMAVKAAYYASRECWGLANDCRMAQQRALELLEKGGTDDDLLDMRLPCPVGPLRDLPQQESGGAATGEEAEDVPTGQAPPSAD